MNIFQLLYYILLPVFPLFILVLLNKIFIIPEVLNFIFIICYCIIYSYILWIYNFQNKQKDSQLKTDNIHNDLNNIIKSRAKNLINERLNEITKNMNLNIIKNKKKDLLTYASSFLATDKKALEKIYQGTSIQDYDKLIDDYLVKEEKRLKNHLSYEGRIGVKDKRILKEKLGYTCQSCGLKMSEKYGNIGSNYIELHHKIPYSQLKENDSRELQITDFCVLCPNCHRMIHRLENADDIELLSEIVKSNK